MIRRPSPLSAACVLLLCASAFAAPKAKPEGAAGANPEKLIKEYSDAVKKAPDDAESWYNLALAYYTAKKYDDAASSIAKASELNPTGVAVMQLQGAIASKQGKSEAAIAAYEKAREAETKDGGDATLATVNGLGGAYLDAGRWDDAIKAYKAAWKLVKDGEKGDLVAINNAIGNAYLKSGNPTEAVKWFEKNAEGQPDNAATAYNLGVAYRNAGLWEKAADSFKKAADMQPSDVIGQFFAGEALAMAQRNAEALPYLDRYLAADPGGKKAVAKFGAEAGAEVYKAAQEYKQELSGK